MSKKAKNAAPAFSKHQLMESKQFSNQEKDVLKAILQEDKQYTKEQAVELLTTFLKKEVM
ncbi:MULTISPECIES: hypothetical protein [Paenibacillus]|uniref:Uncharacterized protein n=1 Tax=Paenibacillus campinasensis TaxID=66347 RepID=A0A268EY13_9BACL|nr:MULTISPECIES: hypothetical protein [Paenibacillus]MUG66543.1 hypothetical protein [Paenibacillus campinasensis]PAD78009.1 hypothetical protein CHH67_08425 [Paenibacillus campinasensis]PAK52910.1 hypothetical protein CHH75_10790 [Paenibacillus sp. 7541]